MIYPFPQPGDLVGLAYREMHMAVNGTPEQQDELGNHGLLPRPWEPATCGGPGLRHELWQWLEAVVIWLRPVFIQLLVRRSLKDFVLANELITCSMHQLKD